MTYTDSDVNGGAENRKAPRSRTKWYWKLAGLVFFDYTIFYMFKPALPQKLASS
jgi:hypothetical protein